MVVQAAARTRGQEWAPEAKRQPSAGWNLWVELERWPDLACLISRAGSLEWVRQPQLALAERPEPEEVLEQDPQAWAERPLLRCWESEWRSVRWRWHVPAVGSPSEVWSALAVPETQFRTPCWRSLRVHRCSAHPTWGFSRWWSRVPWLALSCSLPLALPLDLS